MPSFAARAQAYAEGIASRMTRTNRIATSEAAHAGDNAHHFLALWSVLDNPNYLTNAASYARRAWSAACLVEGGAR